MKTNGSMTITKIWVINEAFSPMRSRYYLTHYGPCQKGTLTNTPTYSVFWLIPFSLWGKKSGCIIYLDIPVIRELLAAKCRICRKKDTAPALSNISQEEHNELHLCLMSRLSAKLKLAAKIIKENGHKEWQCCAQSGDWPPFRVSDEGETLLSPQLVLNSKSIALAWL